MQRVNRRRFINSGLLAIAGVACNKSKTFIPANKSNTVVFALIADTHIDDVTYEANAVTAKIYGNFTPQYVALCRLVTKLKVDFLTHIGDLIEKPVCQYGPRSVSALSIAKEAEKELNCPKYQVVGNHDVDYTTWKERDMLTYYANVNDSYISNKQSEDLDEAEKRGYYHTIRNGLDIIILNTNSRDIARGAALYDIDAAQREWFAITLNSIPDSHNIVVFSHIALRTDTTGMEAVQIAEITLQPATISTLENHCINYLTLNKNSRIIGWFGGHVHSDKYVHTPISTYGGQAKLHYITLNIAVLAEQNDYQDASELAFYKCKWNNAAGGELKITGYGRGASYKLTY